jgi:GR25 family glycosyltransferase involved in LPS biosynthesis
MVVFIVLIIMCLATLIFLKCRGMALGPRMLPVNFDCYVINMVKNTDRMINFDMEYKKSDLASKPYIRFEAINGYQLGDEVQELVSAKTWLGLNFLKSTKKRMGDDQLTPGMIGCYMSHYGVWKDVQASGKPYGVIFEDDAKIYPTIYQNVIKYIVEDGGPFPDDWDVILLGHWCKKCEPVNQFYANAKYFWGTHGYMISQKGCAVMMKYREPDISLQIDHFMSLLSQKGVLKILAVHPSYVVTSNFGTDIQLGITSV